MNERLWKMMREAWQSSEGSPPDGYEDLREDLMNDFQGIFHQFAESIVRECVQQVNEAIPETDCSSSGAYRTARIATIARITEHFGVE